MTKSDGGQAFPVPPGNLSGGVEWRPGIGMTLRDYFAGHAVIGIMAMDGGAAAINAEAKTHGIERTAALAMAAYEIADAMLKAREL